MCWHRTRSGRTSDRGSGSWRGNLFVCCLLCLSVSVYVQKVRQREAGEIQTCSNRDTVHIHGRPSIHPSIHPASRPSIHPSIHLSIHSSIFPSMQPGSHAARQPCSHAAMHMNLHVQVIAHCLFCTSASEAGAFATERNYDGFVHKRAENR